ncbi:unnamed protein product [Caenorhabditis bovis]|uniref:Uncharacterized protein n=1 Tax=Caenorhabditis bovis TaxID=2654633 RepID=A0A8S1EXY3_9PELO|nr:unnamed protein product [Caenorhabditis bovis]
MYKTTKLGNYSEKLQKAELSTSEARDSIKLNRQRHKKSPKSERSESQHTEVIHVPIGKAALGHRGQLGKVFNQQLTHLGRASLVTLSPQRKAVEPPRQTPSGTDFQQALIKGKLYKTGFYPPLQYRDPTGFKIF